MFPGIILQLSYWYRPDEIAVRLIWICKYIGSRYMASSAVQVADKIPDSLGNVSGILGGLLAYAFHSVSGAGGISGWQW